jgi:hypothetical protein
MLLGISSAFDRARQTSDANGPRVCSHPFDFGKVFGIHQHPHRARNGVSLRLFRANAHTEWFPLRFIQIIDGDMCLLILDNRRGKLYVFLEDITTLNMALERGKYKKLLHRDKLGQTCVMAYDETKRMLAVCGTNAREVSSSVQIVHSMLIGCFLSRLFTSTSLLLTSDSRLCRDRATPPICWRGTTNYLQ